MAALLQFKDARVEETAKCTQCGEVKPATRVYFYFRVDKRRPPFINRRRSACKVCENKRASTWHKKNPAWHRARRVERYWANPQHYRDLHRESKYGVSRTMYDNMLEAQGGGCGICGRKENYPHPNGKPQSFGVDHCHKTGRVRGLLCELCNKGLGLLKDDKQFLLQAILYLERSES